MISILIPIYNCEVLRLVNDVSEQVSNLNIPFEIICLDDASNRCIQESNKAVQDIHGISYYINEENQGSIKTRQRLAELAKYEWLLFLDGDVEIKHNDFIKNYINPTIQVFDVIFGGFSYKPERPDKRQILRWKYGRLKEEVPSKERNKRPYKIIISANFLIKKDTFTRIYSRISYSGYGYDNYYAALLKEHQIKILHIDNEVFHLGIENSSVYLKKVENAVRNLIKLKQSNIIKSHDNSLLRVFLFFKKTGLYHLLSGMYRVFQNVMRNHLTGKNPLIIILQFYKISYMSYHSDRI